MDLCTTHAHKCSPCARSVSMAWAVRASHSILQDFDVRHILTGDRTFASQSPVKGAGIAKPLIRLGCDLANIDREKLLAGQCKGWLGPGPSSIKAPTSIGRSSNSSNERPSLSCLQGLLLISFQMAQSQRTDLSCPSEFPMLVGFVSSWAVVF